MKCILCEKEIDWEHHLPPLPYLMFDMTLVERFCPTCWNRIWAEWYVQTGKNSWDYDLRYESPSDDYIIEKYKGNDLVGKLERETPKLPKTSPLKPVFPKKKHWWQK